VGLSFFGVGIALMLRADIGLDPWSTFHEGLSIKSGLSFGRITQLVGVVFVAVAWVWFRERPGPGTIFNMALVGPWVDLFRPHLGLSEGLVPGIAQFLGGLALVGVASGMYISARLGAGPRDAFILGASRRFGRSIRATRVSLELLVLGTGWLLGGPVGLGTVLFALLMGPLMQLSLRVFRYDHAAGH
jgi:uncharacterized membrane protein YczE